MVLAEMRGAVAVQPQHRRNGGGSMGPLAGLPRKLRSGFRYRAEIVDVMIASRQQGRAGRRAERGGVKLIVPQPAIGKLFDGRHLDREQKTCSHLFREDPGHEEIVLYNSFRMPPSK